VSAINSIQYITSMSSLFLPGTIKMEPLDKKNTPMFKLKFEDVNHVITKGKIT